MGDEIVIKNLDELLHPHIDDNEHIVKYETKPLTSLGENFGSTIISLDVTISNKETNKQRILHLVNKMIPTDPVLLLIFNTKTTYVKEMDFYVKAVPAMLKLQQDFSVCQDSWITNIIPKCYGARIGFDSEVDSDAAILLDNLKYKGYVMKDKRIGLDLNHAKLVLEKLAYVHALPIALKKQRPAEYEACILTAGKFFLMNEHNPNREEMSEQFREVYRNVLKGLPLQSDLIEGAIKTVTEKGLDRHVEVKEPFVTIMHNDLWVNNILFAPDTLNKEIPGRVAFVDFQVTLLNSPLYDVIFFLFSSVETEIRRKHFDELVDLYQESFVKCLEEVGCDISEFSKSAIVEEINRVAGWVLFDVCDRLRIMLADKGMLKGENWYFQLDLGGDEYVRRVSNVLKDFDENGWLVS